MPEKFSFEVHRTSSAPPEALFRLETDGARWSEWARPLVVQSKWQRWAQPPGSVGAIRRVGLWPVMTREETVEYEQDRRHVYVIGGGIPMRDYRAEVVFLPNARGGTDLSWRGWFTEWIPGTGPVLAHLLRLVIGFLAIRLVRAAEGR
jgi:Polyketide cyclase / dehydrase and lipid transport